MAQKEQSGGNNRSGNQTLQEVIEARISRRGFLGSGLAAAATVSLSGMSALLNGSSSL